MAKVREGSIRQKVGRSILLFLSYWQILIIIAIRGFEFRSQGSSLMRFLFSKCFLRAISASVFVLRVLISHQVFFLFPSVQGKLMGIMQGQ